MKILRNVRIGLIWIASLLGAAPVIVAGMLVSLVSTSVRALARMLEPSYMTWNELMEFDRVLGWKPRSNLDTFYMVPKDDIYRIRTDSEGWPREDPLGDEHDVLVIGDSYAFGFGIDTGSSFADITSTPRVKAVGANGYSMVHGLILMRELAHRISGKLVVWFVYVENDLYDNLFPGMAGYRAPFVRKKNDADGWEIVANHLSPDPWRASARVRPNIDILAELCTSTALSEHIYSACEYLIGEAADVCRQAGAQLVVFAIPNVNQLESRGRRMLASRAAKSDRFDAQYPEQRINEICSRRGVPFVPGSSTLEAEDYKTWERWHWNERGHARVAELVRRLYEAHTSGKIFNDRSDSSDHDLSHRVLAHTTA